MLELIDRLFEHRPFEMRQADKVPLLLDALNVLTAHHHRHCEGYRRYLDGIESPVEATTLGQVPWLPVGVFKRHRLTSVPAEQIVTSLHSSGTTGAPSRVELDQPTSTRQSRALVRIMSEVLGSKRLPMLVVDAPSVRGMNGTMSARGAGAVGLMMLGRDHLFALHDDLSLDVDATLEFLARHGQEPFFVFGTTATIWDRFIPVLESAGADLSRATLIHGGGWKRLESVAVDDASFKARLRDALGIARVYDFYGMAEQVGSVFLEGDDGLLHAPVFAEVIVREPGTWEEAPVGTPGVLQVLSALPTSYPGHSLLTEDLGVVEGIDAGWGGTAFRVIGRLPRAEARGCGNPLGAVPA